MVPSLKGMVLLRESLDEMPSSPNKGNFGDAEKIVEYISQKFPDAIGATKAGKDLIMALIDQAMVPSSIQDKIEGMLGIGE